MDMGAGQPDVGVVEGQHRSMSLCREGPPEGPRTGPARCSTMLPRQPQRRIPGRPNGYFPVSLGKRSVNPVWTWERADQTLPVVDGQHRSMSPVQGGRADRIGSLFDGVCPTAATPDTG